SPPSTESAPLVIREAVNVEALRQLCRYSGVSDVGQLPKELQKDVEDIMERVGTRSVRQRGWTSTSRCATATHSEADEDTPKLRRYIENRTECEAFLDDRDLAKELFRGLMNTGGETCRSSLEFQAEQWMLLGKDVANHPELARQLSPGTLQSVLNEEYERKNTDLLAELSSTFGLVNSYEHDGIYCLAMHSQHSELLARANAI
ncbi:unnamed protein product, partial [Effrenium voratum]